jgi:phosphoadenosine phosphosulfate reductase
MNSDMNSNLTIQGTALRLYAKPSVNYAQKLAQTQAWLQDAVREYSPVTQASSLGAEDVVLTHLIESLSLPIRVFVLVTGKLHPETLTFLNKCRASSSLTWAFFEPDAQAADLFVRQHGEQAMYQSVDLRKACCHVRKVEPLQRALVGYRAWLTGIRREQSSARSEVPAIDLSEQATTGRAKFNPLVDWTWGDIWHYIQAHDMPYHPLHDAFFPSIGCAPCTRAVTPGEDFRSGRWWWEQDHAKECGLHIAPQSNLSCV